MQHIEHRVAHARAEIDRAHARAVLLQLGQRGNMPLRQITDMDIVAHAGAVVRGIVVAEHAQKRELARRHLRDIRQQIVRNAVRILADQAALVRADRVEIAKQRHRERFIGVRRVPEHLLDHQLGPAVGVRGGQRRVLADRHARRIAVDGCA